MSRYLRCWDFDQKGSCPRGTACKWSHEQSKQPSCPPAGGPDESQFCWDYQRTGRCPRGTQCRWIHELVLLPWPSPSMVPLASPLLPEGFPSTPESYWDQFDENRRLFGTTSTYDPSMSAYTTPLVMETLTRDQIERAEQLSRIPLPSEKLSKMEQLDCVFCHNGFDSISQLLEHIHDSVLGTNSSCSGANQVKTLLKRKSWIVLQETLPSGLVSQIESLYRKQITSSTNLLMIFEAVTACETSQKDEKDYLINELLSLAALVTHESSTLSVSDRKPTGRKDSRKEPISTQ
jgi:hypothetical protein